MKENKRIDIFVKNNYILTMYSDNLRAAKKIFMEGMTRKQKKVMYSIIIAKFRA